MTTVSRAITGVRVKDIHTPNYQRRLEPDRAKAMARAWNAGKFNLPTVSHRDGYYWILDGQHTLEGYRLVNPDLEYIQAVVLTGLTYEQEAALFAERNGTRDRKIAQPLDRFHARLEAKEDVALAIKRLATDVGLDIPRWHHNGGPNTLQGISTVETLVKRHGLVLVGDMLRICRDAWKDDERALHNMVMKGIVEFIAAHRGNYDRKRLVMKLRETTPSVILSQSATLRYAERLEGPTSVRRVIEAVYDKHLKDHTRKLKEAE
jgi:hypothetical protein